jgi:hypothetical protein
LLNREEGAHIGLSDPHCFLEGGIFLWGFRMNCTDLPTLHHSSPRIIGILDDSTYSGRGRGGLCSRFIDEWFAMLKPELFLW